MKGPKRPNILFIISDQHNFRALGIEGNKVVRTPSLDQLAREGASFDKAYCQNPICVPSRSSIITGQYSRNIGIYDNRQILDPSRTTLPRVLKENGYRTCLIGKAHFNGEQFQGFQERPYGDILGQGHQPDPVRANDKGEAGYGNLFEQAGPSGIPRLLQQTEICSSEAAKWLQIHRAISPDQPFFLSLQYDKPHQPFNPPAPYHEFYRDKVKLPRVPDDYFERLAPPVKEYYERMGYHQKPAALHRNTLAAYYGCVEWVDSAIGHVLAALKYLGFEDNTIVVYTSDHGEMAGEHKLWQKSVFYEASVKVPLIIRWPKQIKPRSRYKNPVGLLDLFPTLCQAAQVTIPDTCDGISLLPLFNGRKIQRDAIFSETFFPKQTGTPVSAGCMIRKGKWKYNLYLDGSEELYDLLRDPEEWNNLAGSRRHQDVVRELGGQLRKFWNPKEFDKYHAAAAHVQHPKHCYWFSNQFMLGNGMIVDARP